MSYNILRISKGRLAAAALSAALFAATLAVGVQLALASTTPLVSGTYDVVQKTDLGSQEQIRIRIHLVNHGPSSLSIQRMTLWDFSHPEKGGTRACAVAVGAHASADTTQEFTIQRSDYQMWQKGMRPRLVLQFAAPGNARSKTVVRLDRISGQEAK